MAKTKGQMRPAREINTGDQVVYHDGTTRLVTQVRREGQFVILSHEPLRRVTASANTLMRVVRPTRRAPKATDRDVVHTSETKS